MKLPIPLTRSTPKEHSVSFLSEPRILRLLQRAVPGTINWLFS